MQADLRLKREGSGDARMAQYQRDLAAEPYYFQPQD